MGEVLKFRGITTVDEPPESILEKAKGWGMTQCVVLGFDEHAGLKFGGSLSDAGQIMLMLEAARLELIKTTFE